MPLRFFCKTYCTTHLFLINCLHLNKWNSAVHVRHFATISIIHYNKGSNLNLFRKGGMKCHLLDI